MCGIFIEPEVHGNHLRLEFNPLLTFNELPSQMQTKARKEVASHCLWLDERFKHEISADDVSAVFDAWFGQPSKLDDERATVYIIEIVYCTPSSTGPRIHIRDADERHHLPSERQRPLPSPLPGIRTLKLFIDLYYDDFGIFSFVYNALGGVYIVIGNLPLKFRQKLRNINLLGFVPFGVSFEDFIQPFVKELKELENGVLWDLDGEKVWVIAGIFVILAFLF